MHDLTFRYVDYNILSKSDCDWICIICNAQIFLFNNTEIDAVFSMYANGNFVQNDINNYCLCQLMDANNLFLPLRTESVLDDDDIDLDSNF